MKFGDVLKSIREERGLTQKDVEKMSGVTQAAISRYEMGSDPTWEIVCKLADALKVPLEVFRGKVSAPKVEVPEAKKLRIVVSLADTDVTILDVERKIPR
jgi:transcriptional regulator with XRE-family HTH domain